MDLPPYPTTPAFERTSGKYPKAVKHTSSSKNSTLNICYQCIWLDGFVVIQTDIGILMIWSM